MDATRDRTVQPTERIRNEHVVWLARHLETPDDREQVLALLSLGKLELARLKTDDVRHVSPVSLELDPDVTLPIHRVCTGICLVANVLQR